MQQKNALIVGGTSGLGLELAKILMRKFQVKVVGRHDPCVESISYIKRDISNGVPGADNLIEEISQPIEMFVFAAGFYQEGTIAQLTDADILRILHLGGTAVATLVRRIIICHASLPIFMPITSTSEWTPRLKEPIYTYIKGGLGRLAESLSYDPAIGKTLHVAPAGMNTGFFKDDRDMNEMLDPAWVADKIVRRLSQPYKYRYIKILRCPPRVVDVRSKYRK